MTLQDLYTQIGGNYQEVISRLRMDRLVERFVIRFLDDTSCKDLIEAWATRDEDATFKAAHTAKGVCANLAITSLYEPANQICEALRPGNEDLRRQTDIDALVRKLDEAYAKVVEAIETYRF